MAVKQKGKNMAEETEEKWLVWSFEHKGWWVGYSGYTKTLSAATRFRFEEAKGIVQRANHSLWSTSTPEETMHPDWMDLDRRANVRHTST